MICLSSEKLSWGSENQDIAGYFYHILYNFLQKKDNLSLEFLSLRLLLNFLSEKVSRFEEGHSKKKVKCLKN